MSDVIYLNGKFTPANEAKVSVMDRGFLYGDGIFETMRVYDGVPFRWNSHIERMTNSARALEIKWTGDNKGLRGVVDELLRLNNLSDAYLRITVSRGLHTGNLGFDSDSEPTLAIIVDKLNAPSAEQYEKGGAATMITRSWISPMAAHKATSYLPYLVAKNQARKTGVFEALLCDHCGNITEGATSNVFIAIGGKVFTPPADKSILNGIARQVAIDVLKTYGVHCQEDHISIADAIDADEIFITNSLIEIFPITVLDEVTVGDGKAGPITKKAIELYRREVKKEIEANKNKR